MIYRIGQTYRDAGNLNDPGDQFSRWITVGQSSISNGGGIRAQWPADATRETSVPANLFLVTADVATSFDNPWSTVIDYRSGTIEYWGDAKADASRTINDFRGNKILSGIYSAIKQHGIKRCCPILHFSRIGRAQLRFNGLCVLEKLEEKDFLDDDKHVLNLFATLTVLDADEVSVEWLRRRVLSPTEADVPKDAPEVWRDLQNDQLHRIDPIVAEQLNPAAVSSVTQTLRTVPGRSTLSASDLREGIPDGITHDDVLKAITDLDAGTSHGFGESTTYDLLHAGKRYPPKAVLGLAARRILGRQLDHSEFKGGELSQCFRILRALGFEIVLKNSQAQSSAPRWWVIGAGAEGSLWNEFQEQGIAAIRFGDHEDLRTFSDRESIAVSIRARRGPDAREPVNDSLALWQFANEISVGDYLVAKIGAQKLLGVGIVESDYFFDESRTEFRHVRKVRWIKATDLVLPKKLGVPLKALTDITEFQEAVDFVKDFVLGDEVVSDVIATEELFSIDQAMQDLFMPKNHLQQMLEAWGRKRNLLLQGPPGVGKTFVARILAFAMMGMKDKTRVEMVQFHQSYAYEDFVQGWRPDPAGGFRLRNGVFYEFCNRARMDVSRPYIFIIDEINRGNLSRIFGELMMLIEPDKRGPDFAIPLTYSEAGGERFSIPENLYLLGMMNTADRSLAMVDYALRRRFAFVNLEPQFESAAFQGHLASRGASEALILKIATRMKVLNDAIRADHKNLGDGFVIGHSFFCPVPGVILDQSWYEAVVHTEVAPLVREYWCDSREKAEKTISRLLEV